MVNPVSSGIQTAPQIAKTFQPGGTDQERQVRDSNEKSSRTEQVSNTKAARVERNERTERLDDARTSRIETQNIDNGRAAARKERGSVLDVTV